MMIRLFTFTDIAGEVGLADLPDTRAAAWGDFDADGHVDLYVGFTRRSETRNKLYRNDGNGKHSTLTLSPSNGERLAQDRRVEVEVTSLTRRGRVVTRARGVTTGLRQVRVST